MYVGRGRINYTKYVLDRYVLLTNNILEIWGAAIEDDIILVTNIRKGIDLLVDVVCCWFECKAVTRNATSPASSIMTPNTANVTQSGGHAK